MPSIAVHVADPDEPGVQALIRRHLAFATEVTPPGLVYALDDRGLRNDDVTLYAARAHDEVLGIAALRRLDTRHVEVKSMHVAAEHRSTGAGAALVAALLELATSAGYERISLETGTNDEFAPARRLYERFGFTPCPPFGDYPDDPESLCMTRTLPH